MKACPASKQSVPKQTFQKQVYYKKWWIWNILDCIWSRKGWSINPNEILIRKCFRVLRSILGFRCFRLIWNCCKGVRAFWIGFRSIWRKLMLIATVIILGSSNIVIIKGSPCVIKGRSRIKSFRKRNSYECTSKTSLMNIFERNSHEY